MNHLKIANIAYDTNLRTENLYHLASSATHILTQSLEESLEMYSEEIEQAIGIEVPSDFVDYNAEFMQLLVDQRKLGFLALFATPVVCKQTGTCSWGRYYTKWIYSESLKELYKKGSTWRVERSAV